MKHRVLLLALIGATSAQIIRQSLVDDIKATTTSWFPVDDVRDNMFYGMTDLEVKSERSTYTLSRVGSLSSSTPNKPARVRHTPWYACTLAANLLPLLSFSALPLSAHPQASWVPSSPSRAPLRSPT